MLFLTLNSIVLYERDFLLSFNAWTVQNKFILFFCHYLVNELWRPHLKKDIFFSFGPESKYEQFILNSEAT